MGPQWGINLKTIENKKQIEKKSSPDINKLSFYFRNWFQATGLCDMAI